MRNLRHLMTLKQDSSNDADEDPTYTDWKTDIPANFVPVAGGEKYRGYQLEASVNFVIETRWMEGLDPTFRAIKQETNEIFEISRILPDKGRRRRVLITATNVAS